MKKTLDHLVLPVGSLDVARSRLEDIGFSVAPDARHPFGTSNACVYFREGSYLEPLALWDPSKYDEAAAAGNVFASFDRQFRARNGTEGLSALVLSTDDAEGDHGRFSDAGISPGSCLEFGRPFRTSSGDEVMARFRLAFAQDPKAQDILFFACQRINLPTTDRPSVHANGTVGIRQVIAMAPDPESCSNLLRILAPGCEVTSAKDTLELTLGEARFTVVTPHRFTHQFGLSPGGRTDSLHLRAIVFATTDMEQFAELLTSRNIGHHRSGHRIVVPADAGQGTVFAFEPVEAGAQR